MRGRDKNAYNLDRIARGECPECGDKNDRLSIGGRYCKKCLIKHNQRLKIYKQKRQEQGRCECGKLLDRDGWYCEKCKEKHRLEGRKEDLEKFYKIHFWRLVLFELRQIPQQENPKAPNEDARIHKIWKHDLHNYISLQSQIIQPEEAKK